ncbi:MAG TPA: A/G-specific adenine glycosylase, partial [Acidobacteriota bacterium]|nr:A/G-specific adenine glycosylase [Acidobacteriota bacterium]
MSPPDWFTAPEWVERLLNWYTKAKRPLPWRRQPEPYRIWVSEVMLQQTRVETALPHYQRFLEAFPRLEDLAAAPEEEVLRLWSGLGYYQRARRLHQAARLVYERYKSEPPREYEIFSRLPGVGPYTAGAVLSIAYGLPVPAVDGNVRRVYSRLLGLAESLPPGHWTRLA